MITKIDRYIAKEVSFSVLISFLFFFFIFFINQILLMVEDVLSKKAPLPDVLLLLLFSLPSIIALAAPFASLLGVLLSIGRLSGDREILAAQSCGIPMKRMMVPVVLLGVVFTLISFFANDVLLPVGTINFGKVYRKVLLSTPELELGSYTVKYYKDALIVTGKMENKSVNGLIIIDKTGRGDQRLLSAKKASIVENTNQGGILTLRLDGVRGLIPDARNWDQYDTFQAQRLDYNIVIQEIAGAMPSLGAREMSTLDLGAKIRQRDEEQNQKIQNSLQSRKELLANSAYQFWVGSPKMAKISDLNSQRHFLEIQDLQDKTLISWKTEFFQKFSIPLACICFVFLAFPLALSQLKHGMTMVLGLGLFVAILYWAALLAVRYLSLELGFWPEVSLFLPNFCILIFGIFFLKKVRS